MNKFCVIKYQNENQRQNVLNNIAKYADTEVPYHIGARHVIEYPDHRIILYSAEAFTSPFKAMDQSFISRTAFLCFDGYPVFKGQNVKAHWAERLFRHFRKQDLQSFFRTTLGDYGLVAMKDGVVTAVGDFSGAGPLFTYSVDGIIAISNRQRMLHRIVNENGRLELDPVALAWVVDQANVFGENSPYKGVKLITPGRFAKIGKDGLQLGGFKRFYLADEKTDDLSPEKAKRAVDAIFEQASLTGELPFETLQMDLTGGMDSRATLAIAIGSGLIDRVTNMRTMGPVNAPDIQVAERIATELDLPWSPAYSNPGKAADTVNIDRSWDRLRGNVGALDGTVMAGDGYSAEHRTSVLCLTGSAGEIYRPHVKRRQSLNLTDLESAKREYQNYHYKSNPVGLLKANVAAKNRAYFRHKVEKLHGQGVPFDDMHYAFYVEDRMPWWSGYMMSSMFGRARINPLANFEAASIMFSVNPEQKKIDRLHFELMKAAEPRLLAIPFLSNQWSDRMDQYAGNHVIAKQPMETTAPDVLRARKPELFVLAEAKWDTIFSMVLDKPDSVLFDALNRDRIEELRGRRDDLPGSTVRFILTLAQMAMLEQGEWLDVKQGTKPSATQYKSVMETYTSL